ncbi:MAG: M15 family metallopeptidase [Candidatus Omnitrophota bacterium]|nr:M15 family metallopeptidase [Candidatus Omnitrophota bacterium]MDZ4242244.1 M15 family metallopeptidase [Candidatus Omnitrophota bacterium]
MTNRFSWISPRLLVIFALAFSAFIVSREGSCAGAVKEIEGLVRVQDVDPDIAVELRYATENNFTGKKIYPVAACALRKETAQKLAAANVRFLRDGYRIKVWDGYRPPYVQKIFWDILPDDRYVANPNAGGSRHNRGGAVDVTLIDASGRELEMPSAYDDFSEKARRDSPSASPEARRNAEYLARVMGESGFAFYEHEWWHFDDPGYKDFPLVDVQLEKFLDEPPATLAGLDPDTAQAVVVEPLSESGADALLTGWQKNGEGSWQPVIGPVAAVLGKNGLALAGEKREGDGRTPAGVFRLGTAFGYTASVKTGLSYRQATDNDFWVDDPESPDYNLWVQGPVQAKSFEKMKREDDLYKYGVVMEYNTDPVVPGNGSAIFLHVWRGFGRPTAGCVAVAEPDLLHLLEWLDARQSPVLITQPLGC